MAAVIEVREPNVSFDLTIPDGMAEIGVDGVAQALLAFPTSKVIFHVVSIRKPDSEVEQRKAVLSLTINTLALVQFCQQTLSAFAGNKEQISAAASQFETQLREIASRITPTQPQPEH